LTAFGRFFARRRFDSRHGAGFFLRKSSQGHFGHETLIDFIKFRLGLFGRCSFHQRIFFGLFGDGFGLFSFFLGLKFMKMHSLETSGS
jgi:hypothetical protein